MSGLVFPGRAGDEAWTQPVTDGVNSGVPDRRKSRVGTLVEINLRFLLSPLHLWNPTHVLSEGVALADTLHCVRAATAPSGLTELLLLLLLFLLLRV